MDCRPAGGERSSKVPKGEEKVLSGQGALVTGGGGGIGGASAAWLARDGASVMIMGRTEKTLVATKARIKKFAGPTPRSSTSSATPSTPASWARPCPPPGWAIDWPSPCRWSAAAT